MKTKIYYFSATGNSLKVAKDLAEKLGDTELVSIPKVMKSETDLSADSIGIVFPVYAWGMPLMVAKFIKRLRAEHGKYFFAVVTCGGSAAGTLLQAEKSLRKQNVRLAAGFVVQMPTNYIVWGGAIPQERQQQMFDNWSKRLEDMAKIIGNREEHSVETGSFLANFFLSKALYSISMPQFAGMDKAFHSDGNCDHCGICERVCPAGNIALQDGKPVWNHKCEQCLACIQWCPKQSIQYGQKTAGRQRYVNPSVSLKELL